jgi:hypothetical protein
MGGSTGSGAAPVVAEIAQSLDGDYLTVGIVTRPFKFEGERRFCQAQEGIDLLKEKVDSLLEAVPIAEVRRLASKFLDCRCQKSAGILYVFQGFLAKAGGKFAVKMRAAAIGTAS